MNSPLSTANWAGGSSNYHSPEFPSHSELPGNYRRSKNTLPYPTTRICLLFWSCYSTPATWVVKASGECLVLSLPHPRTGMDSWVSKTLLLQNKTDNLVTQWACWIYDFKTLCKEKGKWRTQSAPHSISIYPFFFYTAQKLGKAQISSPLFFVFKTKRSIISTHSFTSGLYQLQ